VLGDGPEKERWLREFRQMGLRTPIRWLGMLPRDDALAVMEQKDVLVLTSLKEATASVTLEALSMGMPVICHDACGMAVAVTSACGIKVPMIDPKASAEGFAVALERLGSDRGLLPALSAGAIQRAQELSWKNKISEILTAYQAAGGI
jgi:glycosyltransferase involved in cell wall biosynthesis